MPLVDGVGCWVWMRPDVRFDRPATAVFLDRDGVVIEDGGYVSQAARVALIPGAAEAIALLNEARVPVIVVTNQSGVARRRYGWSDFEAVQRAMATGLFEAANARVDGVYACGYHDAGAGELGVADHPWRKPSPGMLVAAAERLGLSLATSWIVGDRDTDLLAGRAAGLAGGTLVGCDARSDAASRLKAPGFRVRVAVDLLAAVRALSMIRRSRTC
jgi:D-glycero-D-manno-heptose 1,7-bisphosphate phosphatase